MRINHKKIWFCCLAVALLLIILPVFQVDGGCARARSVIHKKSHAERVYAKARVYYDRLVKSARLRSKRRAWLYVIQKFRRVYLSYPYNKQVAPKCLYMMARCYRELYRYSRRKSDLNEAVERYRVLVERFPESRLADDALYALGELYLRQKKRDSAIHAWERLLNNYPKSEFVSRARKRLNRLRPAERVYAEARAHYDRLVKSARLRSKRRAWLYVIQKFRRVYLSYPYNKQVAPKCLYMMARCYRELYRYSRRKSDLNEAVERYRVLVERFPESRLADDALYALGELYLRQKKRDSAIHAWERLLNNYPKSEFVSRARKRLNRLRPAEREKAGINYNPVRPPLIPKQGKPASVRDIRHWSASDYTRVVIDTSGPVSYRTGYLKKPRRFFLDLTPARKAKCLKDRLKIQDGLLKSVRVAQYRKNTVRVVFDLGKSHKAKVFYLEDPFRVVVDAFGEDYLAGKTCSLPPAGKVVPGGKKLSLAQQLGLCVKRVVIDAGHGGKDPGAIGPTGLREKVVALEIAKRVKRLLRKELGCQVILTRSGDHFLPLEQRTAIANAKKADLFISIHANASPNRRLRGVETYFLNFALDKEAMRVAALENATSSKRIGDLHKILNNIMKNAKVRESSRLAVHMQRSLVRSLRRRYRNIRNLGVRQAPFFVLIGARMPSVLVEVSFVSNRYEERRLRDSKYLDTIARGIVNGIKSYAFDTRMASAMK